MIRTPSDGWLRSLPKRRRQRVERAIALVIEEHNRWADSVVARILADLEVA